MAEANNELRFGISALSLEFVDIAEEDELLVRQYDGTVLYKRPDGQVAIPTENLYPGEVSLGYGVDVDNTKNLAHWKIDISGLNELTSKVEMGLNLVSEFVIDDSEKRFTFMVRGNSPTTMAVSVMRKYFKEHVEVFSSDPECVVVFEFQPNGGEVTTLAVEAVFNDMTEVNLESGGILKIKSIYFPKIFTMYSYLDAGLKAMLRASNFNNNKYEATTIDLIAKQNKISACPIYGDAGRVQLAFLEY